MKSESGLSLAIASQPFCLHSIECYWLLNWSLLAGVCLRWPRHFPPKVCPKGHRPTGTGNSYPLIYKIHIPITYNSYPLKYKIHIPIKYISYQLKYKMHTPTTYNSYPLNYKIHNVNIKISMRYLSKGELQDPGKTLYASKYTRGGMSQHKKSDQSQTHH